MRPSILSAEGIREIRMVEEIEEFDPELGAESFPEFPVLGHREIPVVKSGVAKDIAAHRPE